MLLRASALSMSELHILVPVSSVGTPILSVPFSFAYDQKYLGFSTTTYDIVNVISI